MIAPVIPRVNHRAEGRVALRVFDQVSESELINLLMLLPEPLRREVARSVWFDASDRKQGGLPRVREMAHVRDLDDAMQVTSDDLYDGLIVVGYPPERARSRAIVHQAFLDRERSGKVLTEKERLHRYGGDWRQFAEREKNTDLSGGVSPSTRKDGSTCE